MEVSEHHLSLEMLLQPELWRLFEQLGQPPSERLVNATQGLHCHTSSSTHYEKTASRKAFNLGLKSFRT